MGGISAVGMMNTTNGEIIRDEETGKIKRVSQVVNGISIEEMSKAGSEVIKAEGKPFEIKIEQAAKTKSALSDLRTKAQEVETLAFSLSNPMKSADKSKNLLKNGAVVATTSDGKDSKIVIGAATNNKSVIGNSYKVVVKQLASKDKLLGTQTFADPDAAANITGTLIVNGTDVDISATMSLKDIKDEILTKVENVAVELVSKNGTQDYFMVLSSTEFAKPITLDDQGSGAMTALGLTASGKTAQQLSAIIMLGVNDNGTGGIELIRTKNIGLDDVIPATLDLKLADENRVIKLDFLDDKSGAIKAVEFFQEKWNDLIEFYNAQTARDTKTNGPAEDADLFGNNFARELVNKLKIAIGTSSFNSAGKIIALADFGLTVERDSTISLDKKKLDDGIVEKYEDFKRAAGDYASTTNPKFKIWELPAEMAADITNVDISIEYKKDNGGIETAKITLLGETIDITGNDIDSGYIKAPVGSKFEGLKIGYVPFEGSGTIANNTLDTTTMKLTRGAFTKVHSSAVNYTKTTKSKDESKKGLIQKEMDRLDKETTSNEKKIEDINNRAARRLASDQKAWNRVYEEMMQYQNLDFMLDNLIKAQEQV